jgi:hypothetical protein
MTMATLVPDAEGQALEAHEVADLFPSMGEDEYRALVEDIRAHGLHEPIWLHPDGRIIDGRHRYRACLEAGREPRFRTWDGAGSLIAFVVSLNLRRRHLTTAQRTLLGVELLPYLETEAHARQMATLKQNASAGLQSERAAPRAYLRAFSFSPTTTVLGKTGVSGR